MPVWGCFRVTGWAPLNIMANSHLFKLIEGALQLVSINVVCGGHTVGLDANLVMHVVCFLDIAACRLFLDEDGNVSGFVVLFKETMRFLVRQQVHWIVVFDGICPGKRQTDDSREKNRAKSLERYKDAVAAGDESQIAKYARKCVFRSVSLTLACINAL